jgi:hypothetical protein
MILVFIGFIIKSSIIKRIALFLSLIPAVSFGITVLFYTVFILYQNSSQMDDFAGVYVAKSNKNSKIVLFKNGTYNSFQTKELNLDLSGTWETGGVDGMFKFYNQQQNIKWAIPS